MRICGFTIVRNASRLGYPFEESIRSLLPLVDELVIAVGRSEYADDDTWERVDAIRASDARVKPFQTEWPASRGGGDVLSQQTNLALERCRGDWAVYLQADEVLHEDDLDLVRAAMDAHLRRSTEGLLFRYHHFWQDYHVVTDDWTAFYPRAVRAIKLGRGIESVGDACGFMRRRRGYWRGLLKADSGARVFHYGWCNTPARQAAKNDNLRAVFALAPAEPQSPGAAFGPLRARAFAGTHPRVMRARVDGCPARPDALPDLPLTSARLHAAAALLRHPSSARGWARPLLPVAITNAWWLTVDAWCARRAKNVT